MATSAVHTYGTKVQYKLDGVYTDIPEVIDFGETPIAEPGKVDVTNSDSEDFTNEYIGDWREPPEIEIVCNWREGNAVQEAIIDDSETNPPTVGYYKKVYSNTKERAFTAYPVIKEEAGLRGQLKLRIKLVCSGGSTLT